MSSRLLIIGFLNLLLTSLGVAQGTLSIVTSSPLPSGAVGAPYLQTITAAGGLAPYNWSLASGSLPPGLTLNGGPGTISGTPSTAGSYSFTVRVTDSLGGSASKGLALTIVQSGTTRGPDGEVGVFYRATLVALSGTGPWLWDITGGQLPPGFALNAATGVISGTPTASGEFSFVARWTDSRGQIFPNTFFITIYPALAIAAASPLPDGSLRVAYSQQLGVTGGRPPYTASISGALPAGISFAPSTLMLSGTPTSVGAFAFSLTVSDGLQTVTKALSLTVTTAVIASLSPSSTLAGSPSFILTVSGSGYVSGALVQWNGSPLETTFVNATQLKASVPANLVASAGTASVTVVNPRGVASDAISFTIAAPAILTISTNSLPNGTAGVDYSQTFTATGGILPYSWSIAGGALPPGVALGSSGALTGAPKVSGVYSFTVRVTDAAGKSAGKAFSLTVITPPTPLTITTTSLPDGTAGAAYSQLFAVTGGVSPYAWSITGGALPPGLALSSAGAITGIANMADVYSFAIRVADSAGNTAGKSFTLTVNLPPPPTLLVTGLPDTADPAQQVAFDVQLSSAYSLPITGKITLKFAHDAVNPADDPSIQFSAGGRALDFTIATGQLRAFPVSLPSLQIGTVAGRIDLMLQFFAGGREITPANPPVRSVTVGRSVPRINTVQVVSVPGGFNVLVTGYSTPRQVTQAVFSFAPAAGANLATTQVTVPVDSAFTAWYGNTSSAQFGSSFLYTQPFLVQGNASDIASISVVLINAAGNSQTVTAKF